MAVGSASKVSSLKILLLVKSLNYEAQRCPAGTPVARDTLHVPQCLNLDQLCAMAPICATPISHKMAYTMSESGILVPSRPGVGASVSMAGVVAAASGQISTPVVEASRQISTPVEGAAKADRCDAMLFLRSESGQSRMGSALLYRNNIRAIMGTGIVKDQVPVTAVS